MVYQWLKMHCRLSAIIKTSYKSEWSNVFWYVKVYIFSKVIQYTLQCDKTQMLKNFLRTKKKTLQKMHYFFFRELQLIPVLLLIHNSYTSRSTRFISLKLCGIFHFRFRLYFCSAKSTDSLTLKRHNSFQNKNKRKAIHSFAPRPLIFKLQQEVWKMISAWVGAPQKLTWRWTL